MFTAVTYTDGSVVTTTLSSGAATARGYITLTSLDGSAIKISDGDQDNDTDNGANRIGFNSQNEAGNTQGVSVSTVEVQMQL